MSQQITPDHLEHSDCKKWDFDVTHSQQVACSALMGVYGKDAQADFERIDRGLANQLTQEEIDALEQKRPEGYAYRFGPGGRFEIPSY